MSKRNLFLILFATVLLVAACSPKRIVQGGMVRDTIFSVEPTKGGTWAIFLTHDESVVYCTIDEELARTATNLLKEHDGEVYIEFDSRKLVAEETCPTYYSGESSFVTVVLRHISAVPGRN